MKSDQLDALTEYIMLVTSRSIQSPGAEPADRERELYAKLTVEPQTWAVVDNANRPVAGPTGEPVALKVTEATARNLAGYLNDLGGKPACLCGSGYDCGADFHPSENPF